MSTETMFARRWKRPSPAFLLVTVIALVGLVIAVALPPLLLPGFSGAPMAITFRVHVADDQGVPVPNANVFVGEASGQTDMEGDCEITQNYSAKGRKGLTGTCRLKGDMRVEAPGYTPWRRSLADLFGRNYNYVDQGTNVSQEVIVYR